MHACCQARVTGREQTRRGSTEGAGDQAGKAQNVASMHWGIHQKQHNSRHRGARAGQAAGAWQRLCGPQLWRSCGVRQIALRSDLCAEEAAGHACSSVHSTASSKGQPLLQLVLQFAGHLHPAGPVPAGEREMWRRRLTRSGSSLRQSGAGARCPPRRQSQTRCHRG